MQAYVYPGQGSQFCGMGQDFWNQSEWAKDLFEEANSILGFRLSDIMFSGSEEELKETRVTQPAIFVHSIIATHLLGESFKPEMVAGHSLGEFSALVASGGLKFDNGLKLVRARAEAMQKACEINPSTMAAILGLEDDLVIQICRETKGTVVPANFNSPGQIIISGSFDAIAEACKRCSEAGAKRTILLNVGGAFHSPLMEPAREDFEKYINEVEFSTPICPIYQNVDAGPHRNPLEIKYNLISQLTSPVLWTQSIHNMIYDGATNFQEIGPGNVLKGLIRKIDKSITEENI
jgi:[acyl-carrier-protein] S-malonyltransferase